MEYVCAYVTCSGQAEAEHLARTVVEEHLAACANCFAPHTAIYRWQDQVCGETETALLLKTTAAAYGALEARLAELHSYDTPCIVQIPLTAGSAEFLAWLQAQVADSQGRRS